MDDRAPEELLSEFHEGVVTGAYDGTLMAIVLPANKREVIDCVWCSQRVASNESWEAVDV